MTTSPDYACPIPSTHDKFDEAHYFLHRIMDEFHEPEPFRYNLNAFLQALRSVREMLETELKKRDGYNTWYSPWKDLMDQEELLKRFRHGRNIIVHRGMLRSKSHVEAGAFRGDLLKMAISIDIDIKYSSEEVLYFIKENSIDFVGGEEHPWIGEQLGVRRKWIVEELGDEDVFILCNRAWCKMSEIVSEAHKFAGAEYPPVDEKNEEHDIRKVNLLLESSLDPTLLEKWEW